MQGSAGAGMVALVQEGLGWVPTACNLAAALAFAIALSLNDQLTGTSDAAIFAIAPLLLLLTQVCNEQHLIEVGLCEEGCVVIVV